MCLYPLLAAGTASESSNGDAVLGFLLIAGIVWFICAVCKTKPKGWDIRTETRGSIKPRR